MSQAVLDRWNGFVQRLTQRLQEIMAESDAGFAGLLQDPALDMQAFGNAMTALDVRKKDLDQKLNNTFSDQVSNQLEGPAWKAAEKTHYEASQWLEETWERWRTQWNIKLVQTLWTRLEKVINREVRCVRCGAELKPTQRHKSETITCPHCSSVNSVSPDMAVYAYFGAAPHAFAEASALEHRFAIDRYKRQLKEEREVRVHEQDNWRGETLEELLHIEKLERAYWTTYYQAQTRITPMSEAELAQWIESRMRSLYEYDFNTKQVWRQYKGLP